MIPYTLLNTKNKKFKYLIKFEIYPVKFYTHTTTTTKNKK